MDSTVSGMFVYIQYILNGPGSRLDRPGPGLGPGTWPPLSLSQDPPSPGMGPLGFSLGLGPAHKGACLMNTNTTCITY